MAVLTDPNGTVWSIKRRWWPYGGALDLTFGWVEELLGVLFVLLWPFWVLAKFCGVRWVITVKRDGQQVGKERVRGWNRSKQRVDEIARELAEGDKSGQFTV